MLNYCLALLGLYTQCRKTAKLVVRQALAQLNGDTKNGETWVCFHRRRWIITLRETFTTAWQTLGLFQGYHQRRCMFTQSSDNTNKGNMPRLFNQTASVAPPFCGGPTLFDFSKHSQTDSLQTCKHWLHSHPGHYTEAALSKDVSMLTTMLDQTIPHFKLASCFSFFFLFCLGLFWFF